MHAAGAERARLGCRSFTQAERLVELSTPQGHNSTGPPRRAPERTRPPPPTHTLKDAG